MHKIVIFFLLFRFVKGFILRNQPENKYNKFVSYLFNYVYLFFILLLLNQVI